MKWANCTSCGTNGPVNAKGLCSNCVWTKNHPGQVKSNFINPVSKKKSQKLALRNKAYDKIDKTRERICSGCGCSHKPLSHSHLIPVSFSDKFEADERNIKFHCMEVPGDKGCHRRWESHDLKEMKTLLDFEENMEYIKEVCPEYYNKIVN